VQVEWTPWTWGATRREQEVLALQSEIVASEEAAFTANVERAAVRATATMRQLARTVDLDEEIVVLHRGILDETRLRYNEGVITSAEFVDRQVDLLAAELARVTHRVQLAEAQARLLTTLGREVR
jgi:outer membrane protein TolC